MEHLIDFVERYDTKRAFRDERILDWVPRHKRTAKLRRDYKRVISKGRRRYYRQLARMVRPRLHQQVAFSTIWW